MLALVAGVVYVVAMFLYSPTKAKEILIKLFTFLMSVLSAFFALASLYALLEGNIDVLELTASFLATTLVGLAVTFMSALVHKAQPELPQEAREGLRLQVVEV